MEPTIASTPSAIDTVRTAESEIKRRLATAHETAEAQIQAAHRQAEQAIEQAAQTGQTQGQTELHTALAETDREVEQILTQARANTNLLRKRGQAQIEAAVAQALALIMGDVP